MHELKTNTLSAQRTDFAPLPYAWINPERAFTLPFTRSVLLVFSSSKSSDHLLLPNSFTSSVRWSPSESHLFPSFEESKD